jgi:hypothetical protein
MSKQRYLLTVLLLLLSCCGFAAQGTWIITSDLGLIQSGTATTYSGRNRLYWETRISPEIMLHAGSNLVAADRIIAPDVQKIWHNGDIGIEASLGNFRLRAAYRNLAFANSSKLGLFPLWDNLSSQERIMQHQGSFTAEYAGPLLQAGVSAQGKYLRYTPWVLDLNTFELVQMPDTGITDLYYGVDLRTVPIKGISAHVAAIRKDATYATEGLYDLDALSGGLDAQYKLGTSAHIAAGVEWKYRAGDSVPGEKRNLVQSSVRYGQRLANGLAGYLYYVNNSCVTEDLDELLLVSNYFRGQLQYTFQNDASGGSYLLVGAKYSPENKADAYFLAGDYRIWKNLYTGVSVNLQPQRQTTITGKVGYYYTPYNELHLIYTHRNNEVLSVQTGYIGLGSSLYW